MTERTKMKEPVKPLEPGAKCTGSNALSYQINHSNRRPARLGETLCRKGRRYGSEKRKLASAQCGKRRSKDGKYAANGKNHTVECEEGHR